METVYPDDDEIKFRKANSGGKKQKNMLNNFFILYLIVPKST